MMSTDVVADGQIQQEETAQYLYFYLSAGSGDPTKLEDEGYALPMSAVREIIRVPTLNQVPLSGPAMLGVTNLRGSVLPVFSLRRLVGRNGGETTQHSRILVLRTPHPIGIWVDWVEKVADVPTSRLDQSDLVRHRADHQLLSGFVRPDPYAGSEHTRMRRLLDAEAVYQASQCAPIQTDEALSGAAGGRAHTQVTQRRVQDTEQYVCFDIGDQAYALGVRQVKEVVRVPAQLEPVSGMADHVIGILSLRSLMIPLIRLSVLYGLKNEAACIQRETDSQRVIVVPVGRRDGTEFIGLVVDRINEVVSLSEDAIQPVPDMLSQMPGFQDINGMMRVDTGDASLTALLDVRKLMTQQAFKAAAEAVSDSEVAMTTEQDSDDGRQIVVFRLDREEYGVAIEATKEILRVPETLTRVPQADAFIEGVINLRGMVLPVIDLRKRFALPDEEKTNQQRIIVLNLDGQRTGFIVDAVREVLRVNRDDIEAAPPLSPEQNSLITEMANMTDDNRMVLLLDVGRLVSEQEARNLARVSDQGEAGAQ